MIAVPAPADVMTQTLYRGKALTLNLEQAELPNGERATLEIIRHPGGAAALALNERGEVCLLRQYRHAAGGWLWELPAGRIEPGESALETARCELAEEAGVNADAWQPLTQCLPSPGICDERLSIFLARGLTPVASRHETHEIIEIHWLPLAQALQWLEAGTLLDAKTMLGLYAVATRLAAAQDR